MASAEREQRRRRALSHIGGSVELVGGSPEERDALERALCVQPDESASLAHVHGFHSYPARLHPHTAAVLIDAFSKGANHVLDPFCGSGTVLVEAMLKGRKAIGVDANPLAIELAWLKTRAPRASWVGKLEAAATRVAEHADGRRLAKAGSTRRYGAEDRELFQPHVLLELDGLRDGIAHVESLELRRALGLSLSSILTKVSLRTGDSSERTEPKRIATGYTIKLFTRKVSELVQRIHDLEALLPERVPGAKVELGDARRLSFLKAGSVDLIVSSPPYAGVYDYFEHHKARLRWLGLHSEQFEHREIGARRRAREATPARALDAFIADFSACLSEAGRVLTSHGRAALIVADSVLAGRAIYADELIADLAPRTGLEVLALASQPRPHFHLPTRGAFRRKPRAEHLILLGANDSPAPDPRATRARPSHGRPSGERDR